MRLQELLFNDPGGVHHGHGRRAHDDIRPGLELFDFAHLDAELLLGEGPGARADDFSPHFLKNLGKI